MKTLNILVNFSFISSQCFVCTMDFGLKLPTYIGQNWCIQTVILVYLSLLENNILILIGVYIFLENTYEIAFPIIFIAKGTTLAWES